MALGSVGKLRSWLGAIALSVAAAIGVLPLDVAWADEDTDVRSSTSMTISPGGVDMRTGRFSVNEQDLAIGSGSPGVIEFRRTTAGDHPMGTGGPGALMQFDDNWNMPLKQYRYAFGNTAPSPFVQTVVISVLGTSYSFVDGTGGGAGSLTFVSNNGYATLVRTMVGSTQNYYTLTTSDGTQVVFQTIAYPGSARGTTAYPLSITHPNGETYTLTYGAGGLSTVVSNTGYGLILERNGSNQITKACVINLTTTTASTTCPTGAQTVSYSYSGNWLTSLTDRVGGVWTYSTTWTSWSVAFVEKFYRPGETSPYLTNTWDHPVALNDVIVSQDYADGRHFDYSYADITYMIQYVGGDEYDKDFNLGTGWTLNGLITTSLAFDSDGGLPPVITSTPINLTDAKGRVFTWTYPYPKSGVGGWGGQDPLLQGRTMPEGNSESYTYDSFHNRTQTDRAPKPGSPLAHIVTTAAFGNCSNPGLVACDKPTATVDADGNETDYTFSATHGGVLTVSLPADPSGVRPVKRYTYAQRYAWISDGAGGYVHAGPPIWVRTEERICRTTATTGSTCAGGSTDETVTAYDYGPDSGPNNLLLRGVAVTADGQTLRSCYGYDGYGRKISETKPNAGLTVCP